MKRCITINGVEFEQVSEIPVATDKRGRILADVYDRYSNSKRIAFNLWACWVYKINNRLYTGWWCCITDFYISSYTAQFFTLVFRGFCRLPGRGEPVEFIACATGRHNYIKLI